MKILVIKPSSLGDVIHGLQVVAIMKKYIPNLEIDWIIRDCFVDIIQASSLVENIFLFRRHGGWGEFYKLISNIRCCKYDTVLDMQGLARTGLLTFFAKAKRKIGRKDSRELSYLAYGETINLPNQKSPHALDILLQFLPKFGLEARFEQALHLNLKNKFQIPCRDLLENNKYILLFPESRRPEKQWPYFLELAEKLAKKFPSLKILLIGQSAYEEDFKQKNIISLLGKTTLSDVLILVKNCCLLIANDSAPIHIGAAMQKQIIALFGPTNPNKFGPYPLTAEKNTIIACGDLSKLYVDEVFKIAVKKVDKFLHDN